MDMRHYKTYVQMGLNIMYYRRQQGLAEMVGITQQHLQRIETARSTPSLPTLLDIAQALEIPVQKLFDVR